jgi:hypothetical protein
MIPLFAVMRDYFTIIRDYFYDYFPDDFSIILRLYTIIFSTIYDYFTASAPGKWECADSNSSSNHGEMTG